MAPKWAKPAAILGLRMQFMQLTLALAREINRNPLTNNADVEVPIDILRAEVKKFSDEIERIEAMKD